MVLAEPAFRFAANYILHPQLDSESSLAVVIGAIVQIFSTGQIAHAGDVAGAYRIGRDVEFSTDMRGRALRDGAQVAAEPA